MDYKEKYLKYKQKYLSLANLKKDSFVQKNEYLDLKNQYGGDKCKYKIGDKVRIIGPVGDLYMYKYGIITELHFVQSRGQNYNICDAVAINVDLAGSVVSKRYKISNIDPFLPSSAVDIVLQNLPLEKLIEMYRAATSDEERSKISNYEYDFYDQPKIFLSLTEFRQIFRRAIGINLDCYKLSDAEFIDNILPIRKLNITTCKKLTDAVFSRLRGIHTLNMSGCDQITDAAFVHLKGIHTLNIAGCGYITDAAFVNLKGIHTLNMHLCTQLTITDAAFEHLKGIHTLNMSQCYHINDLAFANLVGIKNLDMSFCSYITDAAFANLVGIKHLNITDCAYITDAAFVHLQGIHTLNMTGCICSGLTDAAFEYLRGIHTLNMSGCRQITGAALVHLQGIHRLDMTGCLQDSIAAARALGLPVTLR